MKRTVLLTTFASAALALTLGLTLPAKASANSSILAGYLKQAQSES